MGLSNRAKWLEMYQAKLSAFYGYDPVWIAGLRRHKFTSARTDVEAIKMLAERITDGLVTGAANKDSEAIRATCKYLGIKHTYKAIREYLGG